VKAAVETRSSPAQSNAGAAFKGLVKSEVLFLNQELKKMVRGKVKR